MFHFALGKLGAAIKAGTGSAGVVPLFSRDYEATGSLGADATFTRASMATYVDSNGVIQTAAINTPRFDYSTGSRALLMEPAATNRCTYSATFDNAAWIATDLATKTTGQTAPNGTNEAVLVELSASSTARVYLAPTTIPSGSSVITMWIKGTSAGQYPLSVYDGTTQYDVSPTITTEWERYTLTGAWSGHIEAIYIGNRRDGTGTVYSAYVWGVQLEDGTVPTSYIPTTTAAVTRAADALSYSGIAADNETRAITDAGTVDVDDWDGVVDATINGADNLAQISSITVYTTGERPA